MAGEPDLETALLEALTADEIRAEEIEQNIDRMAAALAPVAAEDLEIAMVGGGLRNTYTGIEGFKEAWRDWLAPFSSMRIDLRTVHRGDDAFVGVTVQRVIPTGSGAPIEQPSAAAIFLEHGRVRSIEFHLDPDEAMRSAGIAPA